MAAHRNNNSLGTRSGRMERVESADGTRIVCERVGTGRPLVCVHGTGATKESLALLAGSFDAVECVLVERRGRGDSGDAAVHALDREVEDLLAVLDRVENPALFGHSFGGIVALEAARRTDRLDRLALYEPPVLGGGDGESLAATLADAHEAGDDAADVRRFFERAVGEDVRDLWPSWEEEAPPAHTFVREVAAVESYELPDASDLGVPALLLYGDESPRHLRESTQAVADALPDARLTSLEGVGHVGIIHAADTVAAELEPFLRESGARA